MVAISKGTLVGTSLASMNMTTSMNMYFVITVDLIKLTLCLKRKVFLEELNTISIIL